MAVDSRIESLKTRHLELDEALTSVSRSPHPDDTEIRKLKREKLRIKDELASLVRH